MAQNPKQQSAQYPYPPYYPMQQSMQDMPYYPKPGTYAPYHETEKKPYAPYFQRSDGGQPQTLQNDAYMYPPLSEKPDYSSYVDYLEARGWRREQLTLDELNVNLVTLTAVAAGATGEAIRVRSPAGQKISIMGVQQVPRGADARTAHAIRIRFADSTDTEIDFNTKVRITKEKTSEAIKQLVRTFYSDVANTKNAVIAGVESVKFKTDAEWYRFKQGVELNGEQLLKVFAIAPNIAIDSTQTKFSLDMDLWTREE